MSIILNGNAIPKEHEPFFKQTYSNIYDDWLKRKEDLFKEYELMHPLLIDLGVIAPTEGASRKTVANNGTIKDVGKLFTVVEDVKAEKGISILGSYEKNWGWLKKCQYIIDEDFIPLTSNQIIERMYKKEPELPYEKLANSVPATLSVAAKEGKIKRDRNNNGEYEYSLI